MIDRTDPTNRDTVPAMLTPGEFVLNKEASNMFAPTIEQMNNAGLQQRAMKNMGGGIPPQYLNLGGETSGRGRISTEQSEATPWIQNLENREGFRDYVYIDSEGHATIGTGHKLPASFKKYAWDGKSESTKHKPYSKAELDQMLLDDLSTARSAAEKNFSNWNELPEPVQNGLTNMAFQLGGKGQSKFEKMREAVEAGDYSRAAFEANDSKWAEQTNVRSEDLVNVFLAQNPVQSNFDVPRPGQGFGVEAFGTGNSLNNPRPSSDQSAELVIPTQDPSIRGVVPEVIQTSFLPNSPPEQSEPNQYRSVPTEPNQYKSVPTIESVPPQPEQSFGQAFASGRAAHGGGGGVFSYKGQEYSTNIAEEEEQNRMMASQPTMTANMGGDVQHLNLGDYVKSLFGGGQPDDEELLSQSSQSIDQMARKKLQDDVDNSIFSRNERDALTKFDQGMLNVNRNAVPPPRQMGLSPGEMANQTTLESTVPPTVAVPPNGSALNTSLRKFFEPIGNVMDNNPLKDAIAAGNGDLEAQKRLEAANQVVPQVNSPPAPPPANYSLLDANQLSFLAGQGDDDAIAQELINERKRLSEQDEMSSLPPDPIDLTTPILAKVDVLEKNTFSAANTVENTERELNRVTQIASTLGPNFGFIDDDIASIERQLVKDREALDAARQAEQIATSEADQTLRSQNLVRPEVIAVKGLPATNLEPNRDTLTKTGASRKTPAQIVADLELDNTEAKNLDVDETPDPDPIEDTGKGIANSDPKAFSNAKSILKDIFGDLFDPKELTRAAIMYLGGRATGMNGNQALAFSGKQYIARTDAKANNFQTVAMKAVHTKKSLSIYKKTMDPTDLILKSVAPISTGDFQQYYNRITGAPINAQKKKVGKEYFWFDGNEQMNMQEVTKDARMAKGTKENREYSTSVRKGFSDLVGELDSLNSSEGEGNKKGTPILKIAAKNTADAAYVFMQKNGVGEEAMSDIIEQVYKEALVDQKAGQNIGSLESYFRRAWVETQTQDAVNFQLPSGEPVAVDKIKNFLGTIRNVAKKRGNDELGARNDTQLSAFLMETPAYKFYNSPALSEEDRKRYIKDGNNAGISGLMQYMITELSKDTSS